MRPPTWNPPINLSPAEQTVIQKIRKGKLFVFLRLFRHQIFDQEFQEKLAEIFKDSTVGKCPVSPALLALAIILQAYTGVSDDEVIEALLRACWINPEISSDEGLTPLKGDLKAQKWGKIGQNPCTS